MANKSAAAAILLAAAVLGCLVSASLADQGTATYYTVYTRASLISLSLYISHDHLCMHGIS
jgi:hypothetical protein